jgi:cytochrome P450
MYGPASSILLRQAKSDTYIDNIPLLKGTGVKIEMLASHYNPKIYKDPFKFDPARWNITGPENHPFSFGGFGSGAHSCIGKQLALLSSKVIVSVLLLRYDEIQIKEADKIEMVCRGFYQPTAFKTTLIKAQNRQE